MWPELAEAIAGVIEGMTEYDAPREWWPDPDARARFVLDHEPLRKVLGDLSSWNPTGIGNAP
jgi:hypothetical protein